MLTEALLSPTAPGDQAIVENAAGMKRAAALLAALALLLVAAAVRLPNLTAGRPYINYVDEGNLLHPVVPMLRTGRWDPGWYMYPSLPLIAAAAAARIYDPFRRAAHGGRSLRDDLPPPGREYDVLSPELLLAARIVNLLVSLALVALAGLLARRLAGQERGPRAGWTAALLTALVPALAVRGAVAMVDPWAALFVLAALFFTDRLRTAGHPAADSLAAGAMAGFAFAAKYPAVLVGLVPAWLLLRGGRPWRGKLRLLLLLAAGGAAAAVAAMPGLVLHPTAVLAALRHQSALYKNLASEAPLWRQALVRAEWDIPYGHPEIGTVLLLFALGGLIAALRDRDLAPSIQGWALFAAATLLLFSPQSFQPFRNLLPLVAPVCILAALLWTRLSARLARLHPLSPTLWTIGADAAGVLLVAGLFGLPLAGYVQERLHLRDSRTEAVDWLALRLRPDDRVLVVRELQIQPTELARLHARIDLRPWPALLKGLRRRPVRFVVAGEPPAQGSAQGPETLPPEDRQALLQAFEIRARFGETPTPPDPGWWRGNRQIVYVLERREIDPQELQE